MKKIVVTGATGFIGVNLIDKWMDYDVEIFAIIRPNSKNIGRIPKSRNIHIIELSMKNYERLTDYIEKADFFYHLAWEGTRGSLRDNKELQQANYDSTIKAYQVAKKLGCSFFLGSGSQAEYGSTQGVVDENYSCNPTTEYGKQKLNACNELLKCAEEDGIKLIWTRLFSVYGPYDYPGTLVMTSIEKMIKDEPIEMTAGTQLWDYLYVSDAASAMVLLADKDCDNGVYNIASGDYKPLKYYIFEIKSTLHSNSLLNFGSLPYGPHGPVNLTPDSSKIKSLGWKPVTSFKDGINETIKSFG